MQVHGQVHRAKSRCLLTVGVLDPRSWDVPRSWHLDMFIHLEALYTLGPLQRMVDGPENSSFFLVTTRHLEAHQKSPH